MGPEPLANLPEDAIVLHDGWRMRESAIAGSDGGRISSGDLTTADWYPTSVPTTVLGVLVRRGKYPDPYVGLNNMMIPDASDACNARYDLSRYSHLPDGANPWSAPYWFRKEFSLPANYEGRRVWLNLDGINYRADVWVNGVCVANAKDTVGMFRRFRLDITSSARIGAGNVVAIAIHPPDHPGDPVTEQLECLKGDFGPNSGDGEILRDVTQYSALGWDWVPAARDRNMGIWQHVWLQSTGPVVVSDPAVFTDVEFSGGVTADTSVRFFATNASDQDEDAELVVRLKSPDDGEMVAEVRKTLTMPAGTRREVVMTAAEEPQLRLVGPRLWWPVNYGAQPLYQVEVRASAGGRESSRVNGRFGVREVSSHILPSGGRAFKVNGRPVRIAGGAWVPDFMMSWSARRYRDEVRLMAEGNATLVRVNGCGILPPEVFLNACDEQGLLVWQDLSRTSATGEHSAVRWDHYPKRCDPDVYMANIRDFIARARGHCSILLWCGSNEAPPQEDIGRMLQDEVMPQMDPTRVFLASSSEQPPWAKTEIATKSGGPWKMLRVHDYYRLYDSAKGFESRNEIGLPSLPPINSLAPAIPDFNEPWDEFFPLNKAMSYHDAVGGGNGDFRGYVRIMHEDMGKSSSIAEMLRWGDLYNHQAYRTIFEAGNRARPRNELNTLWKSNAAWVSFFWQIFDWNLRPNAGYYTMKSALKPLHVQFSHDDHSVHVISTLAETLDARVEAVVMRADGSTVGSRSMGVQAPANGNAVVMRLDDLIPRDELVFVAMVLQDAGGRQLDRVVTWTQVGANWKQLLSMPSVAPSLKILKLAKGEVETEIEIEFANESTVPAVNVMLELVDGCFGREVLPSFWTDNALVLMPGERKIVKVSVRNELAPSAPWIVAEGLNLAATAWPVAGGQKRAVDIHINALEPRRDGENPMLHFTATPSGECGSRISTGRVAFKINGELQRFVSVAVQAGAALGGRLELTRPLDHGCVIELGDKVLVWSQAADEKAIPR